MPDYKQQNAIFFSKEPTMSSKLNAELTRIYKLIGNVVAGASVLVQYSVDGVTDWHTMYAPADNYVRFSSDGGSNWSTAMSFSVGTDATYHHQQVSPSATWTVCHGLGKYPAITVIDSAGTMVEGSYDYVDSNNCVLNFASAFGGDAYFN